MRIHDTSSTDHIADRLAAQRPEPSGSIAITHATVIDATGAPPQHDTTVLVERDRIVAIGPSDLVAVPSDTHVLDAHDRFVIPGLWDMHVHIFESAYLPLFLVNGVTGIRHMGAAPVHFSWREQLIDGDLLAPRMAIASRIIDGPYPLRPNSLSVSDAPEARDAVQKSQQDGADFLKVYNLIPRSAYFALAEEARERGIRFAGHVPLGITVTEAAAAGQASIEHLEGILPAASARADDIHHELAGLEVRRPEDMWDQRRLVHDAADTYDPVRARDVYATFASHGTWQVPTLAVLQAIACSGTSEFPLTDYLPFIPPNLRQAWEMAQHTQRSAEERDTALRVFDRQLQVTGELHRGGVPLMAGTDTFVPGFSLHDELTLLVRSGLTEMEALQSATSQPARYFGVDNTLGTLAPGQLADLLILDHDPLVDIGNTRRIHALVLGGTLLSGADLAGLRTTAEQQIADDTPGAPS